MKQLIAFLIVFISWCAQGAAPIGTNISRYPNTNVAPASSLLLLAVTNEVPATNYNIKISDFLAQATNTPVVTNWTLNISSLTFLTNWANAISNYVTSATNSASVTNWINSAQPASANLTNWSLIPTGAMANVTSTTFLTNWANAVSNLVVEANLWTNSAGIPRLTTNVTRVGFGTTNIALYFDQAKENVGLGFRVFSQTIPLGFDNTGFGHDALRKLILGNENTGIGAFALENATNSRWNTAIGYLTLTDLEVGSGNVALGASVLENLVPTTAGDGSANPGENIGIGYQVGQSLTIGQKNILMGEFINVANSHSSSNIAIGRASQPNWADIIIGDNVLCNTAATKATNILIGHNIAGAGAFDVTIGDSANNSLSGGFNTLIGAFTTAGDKANSIALGYRAKAAANNQAVIGSNVTQYVFSDGAVVINSGNVSIASTGLLGGLVVTQDIRFLGHNSASNSVWVCTNATTGEGEWRTASSFAAGGGVAFDPATNLFNLQYEPVRGSTWYAGTNGTPTTNEARAGMEFSPFWRSLRMGQVDNGADVNNMLGNGSNYWNNTNLGVCSVGFGSNAFVKGDFSSVLGGAYNGVRTNAKHSVIGGGYQNLIDTNSPTSVIAGGGRNWIKTVGLSAGTANGVTISGGSNNIIGGTSIDFHGSVIGGGGDNLIEGGQNSVIAGGFDNQIQTASDYAFIGGGRSCQILNNGATSGGGNYSVLVGGFQNAIAGVHGFIGGGRANSFFGNASGIGGDWNVVVGGASNNIGVANFPSTHCFIGGGHECDIANDANYSVIVGGRNNSIAGGGTNCFLGGGFNNSISANSQVSTILGGKNNVVDASGDFGTAIGNSNSVGAAYAVAIGLTVTNATAGSVTVGELISYNTPSVIAGAGSGGTNYTLQVTSPKMLLGSSNVNIVAVMQTIPGKTHKWSVNITNLTAADVWGISFSSATNRWKFQSWMYGTNAPVVLTNNTLLRLNGESEGTNTLVTYEYFSPAL